MKTDSNKEPTGKDKGKKRRSKRESSVFKGLQYLYVVGLVTCIVLMYQLEMKEAMAE